MGMVWILRQFTLSLKMGLALACILGLGFALTQHSASSHGFEAKPAFHGQNSKMLPLFFLSFQPFALPSAFAKLPSGAHKQQLGNLMLRYGQEQDWLDWFGAALQQPKLPSPETLQKLYDEPEIAPTLPFLPEKLHRLRARSIPWYAYLPRPFFHSQNQFQVWLWGDAKQRRGLLRGDLGFSQTNGLPVLELVLNAASKTLLFSVFSMLLGMGLGLFLALLAVHKNWPSIPFFLFSVVPSFLVGAFVFLIFDWGGAESPGLNLSNGLFAFLLAYKLPLITLTLINAGIFAAHFQTWIKAETLRPFFKTALAKGLSPLMALLVHALRAALGLILTFFVQRLPLLLSGTVVIEVMFGIPGFGRLAWLGVLENDSSVVLGCLLLAALAGWVSVYLNGLLTKYRISIQ